MIFDKFPLQPSEEQDRYSITIGQIVQRHLPPDVYIQNIARSGYIRSQQHHGMTYFINEKNEYVGCVQGNWWSGLNFTDKLEIYDSNNKHLGTLTITLGRKIEIKDSLGKLRFSCRVPLIRYRTPITRSTVLTHGFLLRAKIRDVNKHLVGRIRGSIRFDWLIKGRDSIFTIDFSRDYHIMFGIAILLKTFGSVIKISEIV